MNLAPKSLNANVGPWNSSRMCRRGESDTVFTVKLTDSLTTCQSTSSGTSPPANARTTQKQTSVKGSPRNSSNSSGECRAISAGMYSPPSGASPRNTAPRREVSGASFPVLRYLICRFSFELSADHRLFFYAGLIRAPVLELMLDFLQESRYLRQALARRLAQILTQLGELNSAVRQRFITASARRYERWITTGHRVA